MTRSMIILSIAFASLMGCGGSSTKPEDFATAVDMTVSSSDLASVCGHPGDVGNSMGVGKYCGSGEAACASSNFANICSSLNNAADPSQSTFFCTATCTATSPAGYCGENAACVCQPAGCGCAPTSCMTGDLGL